MFTTLMERVGGFTSKKRLPMIILRNGNSLGQVCAEACNAAKIQAYYNVLCKTVEKHGLKDHHACKCNMDESEVLLIHKPPKVIAVKGSRNIHYHTSGNIHKSHNYCMF